MRYADRSAQDRYMDGSLSTNKAEATVEAWFQSIDRPLERYGPQGVDTSRAMYMTWPKVVRHTPDYVSFGRFIEVKSCWDKTVKVKKEDLEALDFWNRLMPVWVAIYVAAHDRIVLADLPSLRWACGQDDTETIILDKGTKGEKEAYEVQLHWLTDRQRVQNAFTASKEHPVPDDYIGF